MKKISYFISFICAAMFASCSSDVEDFVMDSESTNDKTITIGVTVPDNGDTRVNTDNIRGLYWEKGDKIIAVGLDEDKFTVIGTQELGLISGENTSQALFNGAAVTGAKFYKFIYKGKNVTYTPESDYLVSKYSDQVQTGQSSAHVKDCIIMKSDKFDATKLPSVINLTISNSILRINMKSLPTVANDATSLTIKSFVYNSTIQDVQLGQVKYNGALNAKDGNFIYMVFDPVNDLPEYGLLKFEIKANDYLIKTNIKSKPGKLYEPGMIYTVAIDYANKGDWAWEEPVFIGNIIYNPDFSINDGWTEETTPASVKNTLWSFEDNSLKFNATNTSESAQINSRMISEVIKLKTSNTISLQYYITGFASMDQMKNNNKICIRDVDNNGEWVEIPNVTYPTAASDSYNFIALNKLAIPTEFENKNVQISIKCFSEPWKLYGFIPQNGSLGVFKSLVIEGK